MNVVDSPPGMTSPSSPCSSSGFRTSTTSAPRRRSIAACSRKFPWTASTPIVGSTARILRRPPQPADPSASLADEDVGRGRLDAVEKQDPVQMIELVLQAASLEPARLDEAALASRSEPFERDLGRA